MVSTCMHTRTVASSPVFDRSAAVTRSLLGYGVLVGPLYLLVGIAQGLLRPGFSFARHPLSVLANGDYGWVQTANFALSGLMVLAAAAGVMRVAGPRARATARRARRFGPASRSRPCSAPIPWTGSRSAHPSGHRPPITFSMGLLHFAVSALAFTCFGVSALLGPRACSHTAGNRPWPACRSRAGS
ncbi:MAG: DUF998 domain-containing protein [Vicinamibacterales bacterium]